MKFSLSGTFPSCPRSSANTPGWVHHTLVHGRRRHNSDAIPSKSVSHLSSVQCHFPTTPPDVVTSHIAGNDVTTVPTVQIEQSTIHCMGHRNSSPACKYGAWNALLFKKLDKVTRLFFVKTLLEKLNHDPRTKSLSCLPCLHVLPRSGSKVLSWVSVSARVPLFLS